MHDLHQLRKLLYFRIIHKQLYEVTEKYTGSLKRKSYS